jgi:hypothetical protein
MSIEAMNLALESLERCVATCFDQYAHHQVMSRPEHFVNQTITALRQAIQEASENGLYREGYRNGYGFGESAGLRQAIEQAQKQEPVGEVELIDIDDEGTASAWFTIATEMLNLGDKLYTSPPQRQPLMDEQADAQRWRYMKQKHANWPAIVERASDIDFEGGLDEAVDEAIAAHGITGENNGTR